MKHLIFSLLVIALAGTSVFAQAKRTDKTKQTEARLDTVAIKVETAVCGMCSATIETAAEKVEGVKSAVVDLDAKIATVAYDPSKTDAKKIEQAIAAVGYDANETKRNEKAYKKLDECCKYDGKKSKSH
jgi:copper chaperone CopZ